MKRTLLRSYLDDPFLKVLMAGIKTAGPMHSSLLDITHKCNLRCVGCYYYIEKMDSHKKESDEKKFQSFIQQELDRNINMLTVVGGEPVFEIDRLRALAKHFKLTIVTNGTVPIPVEGLEDVRIAISFWGDENEDILLRGNGKKSIFDQALKNYRNDKRAGFYYTVIPGCVSNIAKATQRMVENGNYITFNFYADLARLGNKYDHTNSFSEANDIINQLIAAFSNRIVSSPYVHNIIATRSMLGKQWGYAVCPSVTYDHPENAERVISDNGYPTKFRAYNADLRTTRRCCVGRARECSTCVDLWAISGWIVGAMKGHLKSKKDFANWLCSTFIFYMQTGFIDWNEWSSMLPFIYQQLDVIKDR